MQPRFGKIKVCGNFYVLFGNILNEFALSSYWSNFHCFKFQIVNEQVI